MSGCIQVWHVVLWFVLVALAIVAALMVSWIGCVLALVMGVATCALFFLVPGVLLGSKSAEHAATVAFWLSPLPATAPFLPRGEP